MLMDTRRVIYKSKKKALLIIISGLLLALAGWLFLEYTDKNVIGWSFLILSVLCFIFGIGSILDRKPYIILTQDGITDLSVIREEIEWDAILQVDEFYYRGQSFIRLLVDRNYKPSLIQPTWFYRLDRLYEKSGVRAIYLRINYLDVNSVKLSRLIEKMIKADEKGKIDLLNSQPDSW